jgi:ABC-type transport system involved in cytochrome bd biosynthesis fused ATPase/permease subunit
VGLTTLGARFYLELTGGVLLIIFGILFFVYLPKTFSEISTVVIFVIAGVLIIRKAILNWTQEKIQQELAKRDQKKSPPPKSGSKKAR